MIVKCFDMLLDLYRYYNIYTLIFNTVISCEMKKDCLLNQRI